MGPWLLHTGVLRVQRIWRTKFSGMVSMGNVSDLVNCQRTTDSFVEIEGLNYTPQVKGEGMKRDKGRGAAARAEAFQAYQPD